MVQGMWVGTQTHKHTSVIEDVFHMPVRCLSHAETGTKRLLGHYLNLAPISILVTIMVSHLSTGKVLSFP